jgi:hypothetical protein
MIIGIIKMLKEMDMFDFILYYFIKFNIKYEYLFSKILLFKEIILLKNQFFLYKISNYNIYLFLI